MADKGLETGQAGQNDEIDFTFDDVENGNPDVDDFDFELDGGDSEPLRAAGGDATAGQMADDIGADAQAVAVSLASHGNDGVDDEIDYEDDNDNSFQQKSDPYPEANPSRSGKLDATTQQTDDFDEIDYEEDDGQGAGAGEGRPSATGDAAYPGQEVSAVVGEGGMEQTAGEFDFGFADANVDPNMTGHEATDLSVLDDALDSGFQDVAVTSDLQVGIDKNVFGDVGADLGLGFAGLDGNSTTGPPDVTVTWGDEVCPLFKISETKNPGSYYLEDVGVAFLPLSQLLSRIRANISEWVSDSDEIHIRVDELGIEFAETTTGAVLNQVTLMYLVALHNALLKNDDPAASQGLNIILTTRPNCALRIKELVTGAQGGKGLSIFQSGPVTEENSNLDDYAGSASQDVSPDDTHDDMADPRNPLGQEEADMEVRSAAEGQDGDDSTQDDLIDYEEVVEDGEGEGDRDGEGGAVELGLEEALDLIDYTNDEEDDEATSTSFREGHEPTESYDDLTNAETQGNAGTIGTAHFDENAADDLLAYEEGANHHTNEHVEADGYQLAEDELLDFSGEPEYALGDVEGDPEGSKHSNGSAMPGFKDNQDYIQDEDGALDDGYLDLQSDIRHSAIPQGDDEQGETTNKVNAQPTGESSAPHGAPSNQTSSTTTVDGDEIDYEDSLPAVPGPVKVQGHPLAADEIDWDDEDKIIAPTATSPNSSTITGKRARDGDVEDMLNADGHDTKRSRLEETTS